MVKPREHRVPMMLSADELAAIDNWRFGNRVATRSEAIRRLCQIGLHETKDLEIVEDLLKLAFDWNDKILRWAKEYDEEHGISRDPDAQAPLHMKGSYINTMILLTVLTHVRQMLSRSDVLTSEKDLKKALAEAFEENPELSGAREMITAFWDDWQKRFPGKSLQPPKD